jgi:Ca2+-binding EF-hand superfamily protein
MKRWFPVPGALLALLAAILILPVRAEPQAAVPAPAAPQSGSKDLGPVTADAVDLVFLGDLRPVLLRVHVRIDGKPHAEVWDAFLGKLFKYLDRDGNGVLNKDEAERAPTPEQLLRHLQGTSFYEESFIIARNGRRGSVTAKMADLDANKDGKVTLDELKAYYKKAGAHPVSVTMGPNKGDSEALTEALFKHLDVNKDGKLSREELAAAPERLRRLDTDDDEMISVAELVPERFNQGEGQVIFGGEGGPSPLPEGAAFVRVDAGTPADKLARRLLTQYDKDKNGKLSAKEIGLDAADFAALDKNKDGQLDLTELAAFAARRPDLELVYQMGKVPKGKEPGGLLKLVLQETQRGPGGEYVQPVSLFSPDGKPLPLARAVTKGDNGGLKLGLPDTSLAFEPGASMAVNSAGIRQYYLQQFQEADVNKKGYLERKGLENGQYQFFLFFFAMADRNGDGKLTEQELRDFLNLQADGTACVVTLTMHDLGRGLFELIDVAPRDGRLGLRELRTAWSRLVPLDRDGDGCVARTEVPRQFQMSVRQSGLSYPYSYFAVEVGYRSQMPLPALTRGPAWFRKMDRNADGDVSPREWLGTEEEFKRIDTDGDGLISADEAERYDALVKKQQKR